MDLLTRAIELVENTKQFAKNRGVDNVYSFFDFIPDEILSMIITGMNNILDLSLVSKRFNIIHTANLLSSISNIYPNFTNENPNWIVEIMKYKTMIKINERMLILGLSMFNDRDEDVIKFITNGDKCIMKYKDCDSIFKYDISFTSGHISTSFIVKRSYNETNDGLDDSFTYTETVSAGGYFPSIGTVISNEHYNYICTKPNTPFFAAFKYYVIISDGVKHVITETSSLSKITYNNLEYHLPKKNHPKYKEIMEIINGDNSPLPIETFDYMPY
ncbi:Hypothetical protein PACV_172 [Pacmanvirus A23]|uniref:Hypothetical protein n=1 Tax=Pacmanvirus A23 TaxID=1932881 RepID=UPI000A092931|nr:Hypothetical protein B9W72_gp170 [Pacmanvirus A23]SIP85887.1 Hypothetical protein PACV_172 [Pacmanvirus A23]